MTTLPLEEHLGWQRTSVYGLAPHALTAPRIGQDPFDSLPYSKTQAQFLARLGRFYVI